ncbi:hypothetical protein SAY87_023723 [Trapa incisa]|uniref:Uncharacterized protein n=1 Tax=Trapa incisa TaxID=236973 RepID=A0AAN7L779_9MYRT|nr:hypothetical protein SAY87_023723 [Trapa incisa]
MGTETLRHQDCLAGGSGTFPALIRHRKGCNYGNSYSDSRINLTPSSGPRSSRKQQQPHLRSEKPDHKRRSGQPEPPVSRRWSSDDGRAERFGNVVMEKVTVLRHGASLDSKMVGELQLKNEGGSTATKKLQRPCVRSLVIETCDLYAGSAFAFSPEPSSLPLPSFSNKVTPLDDLATRDLRRLLRLD